MAGRIQIRPSDDDLLRIEALKDETGEATASQALLAAAGLMFTLGWIDMRDGKDVLINSKHYYW